MKSSVNWLVLAGVLAAVYGSHRAYRGWQESVPTERPPVASTPKQPLPAEFELTDQNGESFSTESLQGKVWVVSFFFTNCPSICWRLNQSLADWQHRHPNSDVRFISITCDPDNDTPEALAKYAEAFKANPARWTFLTGDIKEIQRIGNDMFLVPTASLTHSDRAIVLDRQGTIRGSFRVTVPEQFAMLEQLIDVVESEAPAASPAPDEVPAPVTVTPAVEQAPAEPLAPSEG